MKVCQLLLLFCSQACLSSGRQCDFCTQSVCSNLPCHGNGTTSRLNQKLKLTKRLLCKCCEACKNKRAVKCGSEGKYCAKGFVCSRPSGVTHEICMHEKGTPYNTSLGLPCYDEHRRHFVPAGYGWEYQCVKFRCTIIGSILPRPFQCDPEICSTLPYRFSTCCKYCRPRISVACEATSLRVSVVKPVTGFSGSELSLRSSSCKAKDNGTHFIFLASAGECGTSVHVFGKKVVVVNDIRAYDRKSIIIRKAQSWRVACSYERHAHVVEPFYVSIPARPELSDFSMYYTTPYGGILDTSNMRDAIRRGNIYVAISSGQAYGRSRKKLVIDHCGVSFEDKIRRRQVGRILIRDGCPSYDDVTVYAASPTVVRFSFRADRIGNATDVVPDLNCRVRSCSRLDKRKICNPQCLSGDNRKSRGYS